MVAAVDKTTTPPMPEIRANQPALEKMVEASQRAQKAVSKEELIDAMRSVKYWYDIIHDRIGADPAPRRGSGILC